MGRNHWEEKEKIEVPQYLEEVVSEDEPSAHQSDELSARLGKTALEGGEVPAESAPEAPAEGSEAPGEGTGAGDNHDACRKTFGPEVARLDVFCA